jgi:hypothetical protein
MMHQYLVFSWKSRSGQNRLGRPRVKFRIAASADAAEPQQKKPVKV